MVPSTYVTSPGTSCPIRRMKRAVSSTQRSRRLARYRGDSGSTSISASARTTGTRPPTMNNARQPYAGPDNTGHRARHETTEWNADDRECDGKRPLTARHLLGGERRGVWHRPPRPMPATNRSRPSSEDGVDEARSRGVSTAKAHHAPEQRLCAGRSGRRECHPSGRRSSSRRVPLRARS